MAEDLRDKQDSQDSQDMKDLQKVLEQDLETDGAYESFDDSSADLAGLTSGMLYNGDEPNNDESPNYSHDDYAAGENDRNDKNAQNADNADSADLAKSADEDVAPDAAKSGGRWDKARQAKDQELAALRKELAALKANVGKMPADDSETDSEDTSVESGPADVRHLNDKSVQELQDLMELDEFADEADRNKVVNELIRRELDRQRQTYHSQNRAAYEAILNEADNEYGREFRNEAVKQLAEMWKKAGFRQGNYPDANHTRLAVHGIYARLALAKARSAGGSAQPPTRRAPAVDPARRGKAPLSDRSGLLTVDEAIAEMKSEGKFR